MSNAEGERIMGQGGGSVGLGVVKGPSIYTSDVDAPMFARFSGGKLTAIMVLDPNPGATQKIDITLQVIELLDQRQRGDVPVTTQTTV